ncbi:DEAD-box ATP-dependent RNA helicase RhpA [Campylobacterota bacterium]|nr:DEAD-box ATP-dependent RNA helicase RhpA [Campylobacterota bacterium]
MSEILESVESFDQFEFKPQIRRGIQDAGFATPSPIQIEAIPFILQGRDLIGQAHTGTGKTAAFGLPAMNRIEGVDRVELLVITPTRELATQVSDELFKLGRLAGIRTVTVYGGMSSYRQIDLIGRGAQVVVATPGRLLDLLSSGRLKNFAPSMVVLDEADEMLDMGFLDDIKEIFKFLPQERQTLMFSATMPAPIKELAQRILRDPVSVKVTAEETTNKDIAQQYHVIEEYERDDAILRLIDSEEPSRSIIFARTKKEVDRLSTMLIAKGYSAKGLHGDMEQKSREEVIKSFKSDQIEILVATDVAARGLDVKDVSHVFNYHIPFDPESYVHRIGRTGRAGKKGIAVTLVTPLELKELQRIKKIVGTDIRREMVPTLGDIKKAQSGKLVNAILHTHLIEEAQQLLTVLGEQMDIQQLSLKMLSLLIEKQNVTGPDHIGVSAARLEKLISDQRHSGGGGGRNYNRGGSKGGQRRSYGGGGSSGGYNRDRGGDRERSGGEHSSSRGGYGDRNGSRSDRGSDRGGRSNDRSGGGERRYSTPRPKHD